jgi:hypothetical protein
MGWSATANHVAFRQRVDRAVSMPAAPVRRASTTGPRRRHPLEIEPANCSISLDRTHDRSDAQSRLVKERNMEIPKQQILSMIESRMGAGQAQAAADELPDQVDHQQHAGLLSKFGIDPQELLGGGEGNPAA